MKAGNINNKKMVIILGLNLNIFFISNPKIDIRLKTFKKYSFCESPTYQNIMAHNQYCAVTDPPSEIHHISVSKKCGSIEKIPAGVI
jgi:hypothetical protein